MHASGCGLPLTTTELSERARTVIPTIIVIGFLLLWFFRTVHLKLKYPYEGRHARGHVSIVGPTYHPGDSAWTPEAVKNRAWWNARMNRQQRVKHLFMPLADFWERKEEQYKQLMDWLGKEYRWVDIPISQWPEAWKVNQEGPAICIAGSDVPARALTLVEPLKPFQNTIAVRLAA